MKVLVYLGPRRMELQDAPDPVPGPGDVVVRTRLSAICGSDLHGFREASPRRIPPLVMGHESVGVIEAAGEGVDPARVGERVVLKPILACGACARCREGRGNLCPSGRLVGRDLAGGFAELFAVPSSAAVPIAGHVANDTATLVEPLANGVHVAARAIRGGETVLVIGAGPIGLVLVRAALLAGAGRVFSTDRIPPRLALAEAQGATSLAADDPLGAVLAETAGEGADVVVDAAGFEDTWALALKAVRPGGRIETVGLGAPGGSVDFHAIVGKEVTIAGSYGWTDADFARALELIQGDTLHPRGWFTRMRLADGQQAFERLVDDADLFKVVLEP